MSDKSKNFTKQQHTTTHDDDDIKTTPRHNTARHNDTARNTQHPTPNTQANEHMKKRTSAQKNHNHQPNETQATSNKQHAPNNQSNETQATAAATAAAKPTPTGSPDGQGRETKGNFQIQSSCAFVRNSCVHICQMLAVGIGDFDTPCTKIGNRQHSVHPVWIVCVLQSQSSTQWIATAVRISCTMPGTAQNSMEWTSITSSTTEHEM